MKNQKNTTSKGNQSKDQIKINLKKGKKSLQSIDRGFSQSKSIYKNLPEDERDRKKFRGKIRRRLDNFIIDILGNETIQTQRGRDEKDIETSIKSFISFYKENWMIQDFRIENFSNTQNTQKVNDYKNLLEFIQSTLD